MAMYRATIFIHEFQVLLGTKFGCDLLATEVLMAFLTSGRYNLGDASVNGVSRLEISFQK